MTRATWIPIAAALIAGAAGGCTPVAQPIACPAPDAHPALVATLLFGRAMHDGGEVTDTQWRSFLADTVTPRFPDGLTVLAGAGQWRVPATGKIVSERSDVLLLVAENTPQTRQHLEEVRAAYRARFAQESVGLITTVACVAF